MIRITLAFIFFLQFSFAQETSRQINEQVWKPFIKAFNEYKTDDFLAVHSKDLIRSARDSKNILDWNGYLKEMKTVDERSKEAGHKRTLELRFSERIADSNKAIEVGIYKGTFTNSKGETRAYYGRFHVVLRKENGTWKILVDTDSSESGTIDEADFMQAQSMDL